MKNTKINKPKYFDNSGWLDNTVELVSKYNLYPRKIKLSDINMKPR